MIISVDKDDVVEEDAVRQQLEILPLHHILSLIVPGEKDVVEGADRVDDVDERAVLSVAHRLERVTRLVERRRLIALDPILIGHVLVLVAVEVLDRRRLPILILPIGDHRPAIRLLVEALDVSEPLAYLIILDDSEGIPIVVDGVEVVLLEE